MAVSFVAFLLLAFLAIAFLTRTDGWRWHAATAALTLATLGFAYTFFLGR